MGTERLQEDGIGSRSLREMGLSHFASLPLALRFGRLRFIITLFIIIIGVLFLLFFETLRGRKRGDIGRVVRREVTGRDIHGGIGELYIPISWRGLGRCRHVVVRSWVVDMTNYRYRDRTG